MLCWTLYIYILLNHCTNSVGWLLWLPLVYEWRDWCRELMSLPLSCGASKWWCLEEAIHWDPWVGRGLRMTYRRNRKGLWGRRKVLQRRMEFKAALPIGKLRGHLRRRRQLGLLVRDVWELAWELVRDVWRLACPSSGGRSAQIY